jgi:hypothetical protein
MGLQITRRAGPIRLEWITLSSLYSCPNFWINRNITGNPFIYYALYFFIYLACMLVTSCKIASHVFAVAPLDRFNLWITGHHRQVQRNESSLGKKNNVQRNEAYAYLSSPWFGVNVRAKKYERLASSTTENLLSYIGFPLLNFSYSWMTNKIKLF